MAEEKKDAYEFSVAGFKLKLNSAFLAVAIPVVTTVGGAMWGAFEFYKDYLSMKKKIADYVSPDLSGFDKRLAVIEENSAKSTDYTRDIKNDLKSDIRRNESVTEQVERTVKQAMRETDQEVRAVRSATDAEIKQMRQDMETLKRNNEAKLEKFQAEMDKKIQKALDNPLNH